MKIREGFVSNSSSSSFILLGVEKPEYINLIFRKLFGKDSEEYLEEIDDLDLEMNIGAFDCVIQECNFVEAIGLEPKELLENNTLPEARQKVKEEFDKLGVDIPLDKIYLVYGRVSNG